MNEPARIQHDQCRYLTLTAIGAGAHYAGAGWLAGWYERNLKIFTNLTRISASPDDRILAIIGAGHLALLQQFARESGMFHLESAGDYLCE